MPRTALAAAVCFGVGVWVEAWRPRGTRWQARRTAYYAGELAQRYVERVT